MAGKCFDIQHAASYHARMVAITVSSKYQIVIPREAREQLNITPGTRLLLSQDQDAISPCF